MPANTDIDKAKKRLGNLITKCRERDMSLRQLAVKVGLSPSNMKYIEDGINCPTANIYSSLISVLKPSPKQHKEMDQAYMIIRNTPPPDVCELIIKNQELIPFLRTMARGQPTKEQIDKLLASFANETIKGETNDG